MKNGSLHKKSRILTVLLGLAVAGALLLASCADIFDTSAGQPKDNYGYVYVDLGDVARTVRPDLTPNGTGGIVQYIYDFVGTGDIENIKITYDSTVSANQAFRLPAGTYKLDVKAYISGNTGAVYAARGEFSDPITGAKTFRVDGGQSQTIKVVMEPVLSRDGKLNVTITLPSSSTNKAVYELEQFSGDPEADPPVSLGKIPLTTTGLSVSSITDTNTSYAFAGATLAAGTYLFTGRINTSDARYGGFSEVIHIVSDLTTVFERDFTQVDMLAAVSTEKEAVDILLDEITSWVIDPDALTTVGAGIQKDPDNKTITLNFLVANLTNASAATLDLRGGWGISGTATSVVSATAPKTITLTNTAVAARISSTATVTYTVILRPVVEYSVRYFKGVDRGPADNRRELTIEDVNGDPVDLGQYPAVLTTPRSAISDVGATKFTLSNGALTIDGADATLTTNVLTRTLTSKKYDIVIYQLPVDQMRAGFADLRDNIQSWIKASVVDALSVDVPQEEAAFTNTPPMPDNEKGINLYYVDSRLNGADSLWIDLPQQEDPRWKFAGDWKVDPNPTTSTGVVKQIVFDTWGGPDYYFYVALKPVAEFVVDFEPALASIPAPLTTAKVNIKEVGGTGNGSDFTSDSHDTKRFMLVATGATITLTDASVLVDLTTEGGTPEILVATTPAPASGSEANTDIAQPGKPYTLTGVESRVYTASVYSTIAAQKDYAVGALDSEISSVKWWSAADKLGFKLDPRDFEAKETGTPPVRKVIYVGTTPTGFGFPAIETDTNNVVTYDKFGRDDLWTSIDQSTSDPAAFTKDAKIKFTPLGGVEEHVYTFKLTQAAAVYVTFEKEPVGTVITTGTITVNAVEPGSSATGATALTPTFTVNTTPATYKLVGLAAPLSVSAASTGANVFGFKGTGDYGPTSDALPPAQFTETFTPIPIANLASDKYYISVYPKKTDQLATVKTALKALDNIDDWGAAGVIETLDYTPPAANSDAVGFKIVSNILTAPTALTNATYLNPGYGTLTITAGTGAGLLDQGLGTRTDKIQFVALTGAISTPADVAEVTFNLQTVAKYVINFMPGPDSTYTTTGNVQIKTYKDTVANAADTENALMSDAEEKQFFHNPVAATFYGGIGSNAAVFRSSLGNVFSVKAGVSAEVVTNGAEFNLNDSTLLTDTSLANGSRTYSPATITSQVYTINVYPSLADQVLRVRGILKEKAQSDFITTAQAQATAGNVIPNTFVQVGASNYAQVQYMSLTAPNVTTNLNSLINAVGSTYALASTQSAASNSLKVTTATLAFTPKAPTAITSYNVYQIKLIPVAKFTVSYSEGAQGTITVKSNELKATPPVPGTNPIPGADIVINAESKDKSGYIALGSTTFSVAGTATLYNRVVVLGTGSEIVLTPSAATSSDINIVTSKEYTIQVSKNQ